MSCLVSGKYLLTYGSIDGTFLSWSVDFRKRLLSSYPLPDGLDPIPPDVLLPPKFALQLLDIDPNSGDAQNNSTQTDPTRENTLSSRDQRSVEGAASNMKFTPPKVPEETETCPQLKEEPKGESVPIDTTFPPNTPLPIPDAYAIKLQQNKRLTPKDHWQDVRELTFHMSENIKYQPGDVMTIYPKNFPVDVQRLIDIMGWNDVADQPLIFKPESPDFYHAENLITLIPANLHCMKNSTLRQLLTHNLDITAIPKRYFFEVIAQHTSDPMHKERLLEFTDPKWRDELFDYTTRPRRSILEVLEDFPSVKLPWQWTCTIFPVIRGRQFSISSGGEKRTSSEKGFVQVQLLVAIVKYRTVLKKIRQGLCSRYIASLTAGTTINVTLSSNDSFVKKYKNKEEEDRRLRIPIIMVAPGTGLAPCRSLVWERAALAAEGLGRQVGDIYLFYGGRNKAADYFYKHEWEFSSLRTHVFTAFSRDQKEKIYVQDIIRKEAKLVGKLMGDRKAMVYVCGSSGNMPKAVRAALVDVMAQWVEENIDSVTTASREKVEARIEVMEKDGTYVQETW